MAGRLVVTITSGGLFILFLGLFIDNWVTQKRPNYGLLVVYLVVLIFLVITLFETCCLHYEIQDARRIKLEAPRIDLPMEPEAPVVILEPAN